MLYTRNERRRPILLHGHSFRRPSGFSVGAVHVVSLVAGPTIKPKYFSAAAHVYCGKLLCCGSFISVQTSFGICPQGGMANVLVALMSMVVILL